MGHGQRMLWFYHQSFSLLSVLTVLQGSILMCCYCLVLLYFFLLPCYPVYDWRTERVERSKPILHQQKNIAFLRKGKKVLFTNKAVPVSLLVCAGLLSSQRSPGNHALPVETEQRIIKNNISLQHMLPVLKLMHIPTQCRGSQELNFILNEVRKENSFRLVTSSREAFVSMWEGRAGSGEVWFGQNSANSHLPTP